MCYSNTWNLLVQDFLSFCVNRRSLLCFTKSLFTQYQQYRQKHHHDNMWNRGLWWWSTSVCSNAALQVKKTDSLLSPSQDKQFEWRCGEKLKAKSLITQHVTHTKLRNQGLKTKQTGPYSFLAGNEIWYVLNSGSFHPPESLAKLLCFPFSCKKKKNKKTKPQKPTTNH